MSNRLKIAVSACFFHADDQRPIFKGKTLQYVEQSVPHWIMSQGALPVMVPSPEGETKKGDVTLIDYAQWLDGLVLMGGSDLWPGSYGERPLKEQWSGDRVRDEYEKALVKAFVDAGKPVFGICRGLQLINVAFGGTLLQDIATQRPEARAHRDQASYDLNLHDVDLVPGSKLAGLFKGALRHKVNSVHHQGIKDLAPGLTVEARCPDDGMIEAVRWNGPAAQGERSPRYVAAVQWHPEFHRQDLGTIDDAPMLQDFLEAARASCSA